MNSRSKLFRLQLESFDRIKYEFLSGGFIWNCKSNQKDRELRGLDKINKFWSNVVPECDIRSSFSRLIVSETSVSVRGGVYLSTGVPSDFVSQVERAYSRSNFFLPRNKSRARWKFERPGLDQFVYNSWWNCRKRSLTYPHFNIKRSSREEEDLVLPRNIILENANANSIFGKEKKKKKIVLSIQMQRRKEKKKRWRDERELIEGEWKTGSNLTSSFFISRYLQYVKIPFKRDFNRVIPLPFKFPVYRIELFPNQYISRPINTFVPKETRFAPSKTPLKASRVSRTIDPRWKLFNTRAPFFLNYNQVRPPTMRPPREIAPHLCPRQFQFFYTF